MTSSRPIRISIRTMSVKPPMGSGRVRLVAIGEMARSTSSLAAARMCARPAKSARIAVAKIESKGKQNRRIRLAFAPDESSLRCRPMSFRPNGSPNGSDAPDIAIVDASWHLPAAKRDAKAEFMEEHIPGAQFFDIDDDCRHREHLCPICCRRPRNLPRACASWASATARG